MMGILNQVESAFEGLLWTPLPSPTGTAALALLYQIEKSQWCSADIIKNFQFEQFAKVLVHAYQTIPYYYERFKAAGINPAKFSPAEQLLNIPILSRPELQKMGKALLSRNIPRSHGKTFDITTSGSTGRPVTVIGTALESLFWKVLYLREHQWHDRDISRKLVAIRHDRKGAAMPPHGQSGKVWGTPELGTFKTGPSALLNIRSSAAEQSAWLCRQNPGYLMSYPTNILSLANYFISEGKSLPSLLQIRTVGEILGPEVRQACRDAWNVPVVDMYSCQEVGVVALQCPQHEHYHIQSENLLVEVLNDRNQNCAPGETGKVVISTLHNFAMPLVRYEVGDYAEVGEPCNCGRGLPVLTKILGRQRNMLIFPDGRKIWPAFGMNALSKELPVKQFQFVQKSIECLEARLVTERPFSREEEERFVKAIHHRLNYPFTIAINYLENISRSKSGKFEDFVSEVTN